VAGKLVSVQRVPTPAKRMQLTYVCQGKPECGFKWVRRWELKENLNEDMPMYYEQLPIRPNIKDSDFKVKRKKVKKNAMYAENLMPGFVNDVPFCSDRTDPINLECGFRKRLAPLMPVAKIGKLRKLSLFVKNWLTKHMQPLDRIDWSPQLVDDWLSKIDHYNGVRKAQLREAASSFIDIPYNESDYVVKAHVKREFYEEDKHVRWICSRTDRMKTLIGPYIKKIEEQMFHLPPFVKHLTPDEIAERISQFDDRYLLSTDYSSFESGFSPEYCDVVECELWRYMFKFNPVVRNIMLRHYYVEKKVNGIVVRTPRKEIIKNAFCSMSVIGCRMSGEMFTSLANGFSNLMNVLFLCHLKNFEPKHILIEGDDCLVGLSKKILEFSDFEEFGFKIKMDYQQKKSKTSFCGCRVSERGKLIINPEQISRLQWSSAPTYFNCRISVKIELLRAKCMSLLCLGKNTPIAGIYARHVYDLIGKGKFRNAENPYWFDYIQRNVSFETQPDIQDSVRIIFAEIYHISVAEQLMIETRILESHDINDIVIPVRLTKFNNNFYIPKQ